MLELLLDHVDANTLLLAVIVVQLRGLRSIFALTKRIATHLGVPSDDIPPPPDGAVPQFVQHELERADTQPNTITRIGPAPAPAPASSAALGGKP